MKSLIVEDDNTCAFIFQSLLSKFGKCAVVTKGIDALNAYESSLSSDDPYDIVILDIMMPDMSGDEVLKGIRLIEKDRNISFPFNVKVVLTTALDDEVNRKIAESLDPLSEAYLVKSAYPDELINILTEFGFDLSEFLT